MNTLYFYPHRLYSIILPLFILFSVIANIDYLSVDPGSFYLYKIELSKGVTFRGKILISNPEKPITVEVYDVNGEEIEKVSVLKEIEIKFFSADTGTYEIRFHNLESEKTVDLTFSFNVNRDFPIIPSFPNLSIVIGIGFYIFKVVREKAI